MSAKNKTKWCCFLGICLFISGCSQDVTEKEERIPLKVAIFSGAYDTSYWHKAKAIFEEQHPEVNVILEINSNIGNIWMPRVNVSDVPDVIYLSSSNESGLTQRMMEDHLLACLDDVMDASTQDRFIHHVMDSNLLRPYEDQRLYLAPLYYNVTGLWYNQKLFQQYGYEVPATWDAFFELGEQAKQDGIPLFVYQGLNPTYLEAMLWPMLAEQIGIDGLHRIYTYEKDAWLQEGIQEVIDVFDRLGEGQYMKEDTIILNYMEAQKRFINKEALFLPCGNWLLTEMAEYVSDASEFAFLPVPKFQLEDPAYAKVMVEQIYVPKDAKQVELGKAFVAQQFTEENVALNQSMSGGFVPVKQDKIPQAGHQPFQLFEEGVIPLASGFATGTKKDMDKIVFEYLSNVIAQDITSQEMIEALNEISNSIN